MRFTQWNRFILFSSTFYWGYLIISSTHTVYPKKYAHGFCFAVLCCGYTLTDFPISIRLTSLALWQSNDCPSASKATLMNMDKYFMWIHYERLHNHNKAKHNKTVCIFLGIYCTRCWLSMKNSYGKDHKIYAITISVVFRIVMLPANCTKTLVCPSLSATWTPPWKCVNSVMSRACMPRLVLDRSEVRERIPDWKSLFMCVSISQIYNAIVMNFQQILF